MSDEPRDTGELDSIALSSLIAATPIGIALIDQRLRYRLVNEAFASMHGVRVEEHVGRTVDEASRGASALVVVEPFVREVLETGKPHVHYEIESSHGEAVRHFVTSYFRVRGDETFIAVGVLVLEETAQKLRDEEQRRLTANREQVLRVVAHDLWSPLAAIQLTTRLLASHVASDARAAQQLDVIQRSVARMQRLVEDLADVNAIRDGYFSLELSLESVDDLVSESLITNDVLVTDKGATLVREGSPVSLHIQCDRRRLLQVFANLIANAIRACRQGDIITLGAQRTADEIVFSVRDTGRSIPPEHVPVLFEPALSPGRRTGLGLYICKGIVETHGGRIWAESAAKGTTISFALPMERT